MDSTMRDRLHEAKVQLASRGIDGLLLLPKQHLTRLVESGDLVGITSRVTSAGDTVVVVALCPVAKEVFGYVYNPAWASIKTVIMKRYYYKVKLRRQKDGVVFFDIISVHCVLGTQFPYGAGGVYSSLHQRTFDLLGADYR